MSYFSNWKLSTKLYASFLVIILIAFVVGFTLFKTMSGLGVLQDQGATRFKDSQSIATIIKHFEGFYPIVADSAINMNFTETHKELANFKIQAETDIKKLLEIVDTPAEKKNAENFANNYRHYIEFYETKMLPLIEKNKAIDTNFREFDDQIDKVRDSALKELEQIEASLAKEAEDGDREFDRTFQKGLLISIVTGLVGLVISILMAILISRSLTKVLTKVSKALSEGSEEIFQAATQISDTSQTLSSSATESAASLEETCASVEELSSIVKLNADNAVSAAELSQESMNEARRGDNEMNHLISAMSEISTSSTRMEEILEVIDDIAFQTNLLALNAAVEAARAGEQGKGFAVVADAVQGLAKRSASSAKEIGKLITDSVDKISVGVKTATQSGDRLKSILTAVEKASSLNVEISAASKEQANGITQIGQAINQLDQAAQSNAAASEEASASSMQLSSQVQNLRRLVLDLNEVIDGKN